MASSTEQSSSEDRCKISTEEDQKMPSRDRLSELPDSILCHILSFLSTKHSMATSILARRWRFLWTNVPNLYVYDYDHRSSTGEPSFSDVMNRIFILYNVKVMNTFALVYNKRFDVLKNSISEYHIRTWITAAVSRMVRELDLNLFSHVRLPQCLFTCRTLVVLTLRRCILPILPSDICLPSLKTLILNFVAYKSDENFLRLISGCPMIEELEIDGIFQNDVRCCRISSPTIKLLKICFSFDLEDYPGPGYRLVINAPALTYLEIKDYLSENISIDQGLTSLVGANIILKPRHRITGLQRRVYYSDALLKFIHRLCNVKFLELLVDYAKILDLAFTASPIRFDYLTRLELSADWRFISKFLESADNLKFLVLGEVAEVLKRWKEPERVPTCLLSHLTTMRIDKFGLTENEFEMVRYLLKNAQVLKTMTINSDAAISDYKKKFHALQKISQFERGSVACELYFH